MALVIHNVHGSKLGNMMLKYMVASKLRALLPGSSLSNYHMPEWQVYYPEIPPFFNETSIVLAPAEREMVVHFDRAVYLAGSKLVQRFEIYGHVQRMENFPGLQTSRQLFNCDAKIGTDYGNYVVCPVRGAEILDAIHPGYTLIPVNFYRELIEDLGLPPVFIGQIGSDVYSESLRRAFPNALFQPNAGALQDFQTIRKAKATIVSISTFSWLGAWLSQAQTIVLPCYGLFNRERFGDHDLLPLGDPRYRFFTFSVQDAVPLADLGLAHEQLKWKEVSARELLRAT